MKSRFSIIFFVLLLSVGSSYSGFMDWIKDKGSKAKQAATVIKDAGSAIPTVAKTITKLTQVINEFSKVDKKITVGDWKLPNPDLKFHEACFLGAHNSFSTHDDGYTFYYQQVFNLKKLWDIGVRFYLIDLYPTKPGTCVCIKKTKRPVTARLCHGKCDIGPFLRLKPFLINLTKALVDIKGTLSDLKKVVKGGKGDFKKLKSRLADLVKNPFKRALEKTVTLTVEEYLKEIKSMLDANPEEVVAFELENYLDRETTLKVIKDSGIVDITLKPSDWDVKENDGWPTIRWMKENNKRVIFLDDRENEYCYDWRVVRHGMYGSVIAEKAWQERSATRKSDKKRYLSTINLFPGEGLESAGKFASKALAAFKKKDLKTAFNALDDAVAQAKKYWKIDYEKVNSVTLKKLLNHLIKYGFDTGRMVGKHPNFLSLDQIHKGKSAEYANFFNDFAAKKLKNKNIILLAVGDMRETVNADLKGIHIASRIFKEDFSGSDLTKANLEDAKFIGGSFKNTNLTEANCKNTTFEKVDFSGAKFNKADLEDAKFIDCKFGDAKNIRFKKVELVKGCDFTGSKVDPKELVEIDLENNEGFSKEVIDRVKFLKREKEIFQKNKVKALKRIKI